jgi:hypothetical protein
LAGEQVECHPLGAVEAVFRLGEDEQRVDQPFRAQVGGERLLPDPD